MRDRGRNPSPRMRDNPFLLPTHFYSGYAPQWKDEGVPIVFFLVRNDGRRVAVPADKCAWVLRDDGTGVGAVLLGKSKNDWTGCIPALTCNFEVLTDQDDIVRLVERSVKAAGTGSVVRSHTVDVPDNTAVYQKLWSGSAVWLVVPIDAQLEELGRRGCKAESPLERSDGAKILRHFRNEKNIGLLKSLLQDPSTSEETAHRIVNGTSEVIYRKKRYYVRQAAYDALCEFGVKVDKPVLEELLEGRDDPSFKRDRRTPK